MPVTPSPSPRWTGVLAWGAGVLGIASIGALDYFSGIEVRVLALYYAPLAVLAWHFGRAGALIATALCVASWLLSNVAAGMEYSLTRVWVINTIMQVGSFATVGLLIAALRDGLIRERGLSRTDPLTSVLNRAGFYEESARLMALCRRSERPITVAYIDLDNFKAVNDRLGHAGGDEVLRTVAELLLVTIRPSDVAGRLGGDEFVILFPETGAHEAAITLERLRASLASALASAALPVTGSIGGVTFVRVPERVEDMVRRGDARMYAAKAAGRNRVELEVVDQPLQPTPQASDASRRN